MRRLTSKSGDLWKLEVETVEDSEERVRALLETKFEASPVSYTDLRTERTLIAVYLEARPRWSRAEQRQLEAAFSTALGKNRGQARRLPRFRRIRTRDWAESWKRHFKPLHIGSALLIKPGWSQCRPRSGQAVIRLDPGLSFGTGQHPTTLFCLRELVATRKPDRAQSFLDIGTGSGILAIAAAKLGYAPVHAIDLDTDAVRIAGDNARRNRVGHKVRISLQDLARIELRRRCEVVCANLDSRLLLSQRIRIASLVNPTGILVLAGVLGAESRAVRHAYEELGFKLLRCRTEGEWWSGTFLSVRRSHASPSPMLVPTRSGQEARAGGAHLDRATIWSAPAERSGDGALAALPQPVEAKAVSRFACHRTPY